MAPIMQQRSQLTMDTYTYNFGGLEKREGEREEGSEREGGEGEES